LPEVLVLDRQLLADLHHFEFTEQEERLHRTLAEKRQELAAIYLGALWVHRQVENPDRLALSAHNIRELMEKLPRYINVPVLGDPAQAKPEPLKPKIQDLSKGRKEARRKSASWSASGWSGTIDGDLASYLGLLDSVLDWFDSEHITRREEATKLVRQIDAAGGSMPEFVKVRLVRDWVTYWDYFVATAHHRQTTNEAFEEHRSSLERFLLDRLAPTATKELDELDAIIAEGEAHAES
jgi:hypothetical protein